MDKSCTRPCPGHLPSAGRIPVRAAHSGTVRTARAAAVLALVTALPVLASTLDRALASRGRPARLTLTGAVVVSWLLMKVVRYNDSWRDAALPPEPRRVPSIDALASRSAA